MSRITAPWFALAACVALSACSSTVVRETGPSSGGSAPAVGRPGQMDVVQRGDTLFRVASRNGLTVGDLAAWNGIKPPYTIYPGQRLRLYPPGATPSAGPGSATARATSGTPARSSSGARPAATKAASAPRAVASATPAPAPSAPPLQSGIAWRWPAEGTLLNRFAAGDPTRQGIDIAGAGGSAVRAAGDGTVVYSGSGLVGYGELVIIKHSEAWLSAYGHNRKRLVNEGQLVKAGDQIAEMGRSGASRDMLHFEIRYNGKPVDPLQYLPPR
ncbi:peptidoglycan DD-metalloendopeptidase family protein [Lysobacter korlensis]|uniref:Peptidoglycan DD-metalloendopeptidase family protein n=1 Tax=Lysobacter korlensis TaxID=553636 RepID=A0ABV6RK88_9GAMM